MKIIERAGNFSILTALLGLLFLAGCVTSTPTTTTQQVPVVSTIAVTNPVAIVNPTTGQTSISNQVTLTTVTNLQPVTTTTPVYTANTAAIQTAAATITALNALSAPVNPASTAINAIIPWGVSLAIAIAGGVAAYKNNSKAGVIAAIVQGVESAAPEGNDSMPTTVAAVKASVAQKAALAGVTPAVQAAVVANT